MDIIKKLKETALAIIPVDIVVAILHFTIAPLPLTTLIEFFIGSVFVILGLGIFLAGVDIGIVPAGSMLGASLTRTKNLPLIIVVIAITGFVITVAEPNLKVQGDLVESVTGNIKSGALILTVSAGLGLFLAIAMSRILIQIPFKLIIIIGYSLALVLSTFIDPVYVAIAFDSSGASTGPLTVPFFIALGIGVAGVRGDKGAEDDSFGTTGIAAIGPILGMVVYGFILAKSGANTSVPSEVAMVASDDQNSGLKYFSTITQTIKDVTISLSPVLVLIIAFQLFLLKLPPAQIRRVLTGIVYSWLGLILFFIGANTGFIPAGKAIGGEIGALSYSWILIPIGCILGSIVVCSEPAMWVLTEQVEEVSAGNIRKPVLLTSVALGVSIGVGASMWRVLSGFSVWYLIAPSFIIAMILSLVTPKLFSAIAFDSGSVATGPVSAAFILPITLGAAQTSGGNPALDAFGLIAMIAVAPPISIQILGIMFRRKELSIEKKRKEEALGAK
ncbi:MAG TPA: DUF1538 domain-containing protein [Spirochaetota bacterium]|jgi:hypothetical protein|nr:MAG: hypothetical protein BWX91_01250 [Spirochaetes bacterium ADurb.Bin133]HNZ28078.1 DUF1538 domain-containing protein [Spirochaetota bacterium]HPY87337.1 DUF1538 domain-containing protein [Spirochaetota bacterium]